MAGKFAAVWLWWLVLNHPSGQEFGVVQQTSSFQLAAWATKHYKTASEHFTAVSLESLRHICFTYPGQLILGSCCCSPKSGLAMLGGQIWRVTWDLIPPTLGVPKLAKTPKWQQYKNSSLQSHIWEFGEKAGYEQYKNRSSRHRSFKTKVLCGWSQHLGLHFGEVSCTGRRDSHDIDQGWQLLTSSDNRYQ